MSEDSDLIYVLDKKVQLYQAPHGFRTSMDSVLLGAACPIKSGESLLDLGCGVGSAGLCALYRVSDTSLLGVDIQRDHIELAARNAVLNGMEARTSFFCADVRALADIGTFDHVICNPPYKESGAHCASPSSAKATAMGHIDDEMSLRVWVDAAWKLIKGQGSFTMIHEGGSCDRIIHALYSARGGRRFGNVEIFPVFTKPEGPARRVIVRGWKHKKGETRMLRGIVMHREDGSDSAEANAVLRRGDALPF